MCECVSVSAAPATSSHPGESVCVRECGDMETGDPLQLSQQSSLPDTTTQQSTIDTSVTKTQLKIQDLETNLSDFLLPNCSLKTQKGRIVLQIKIEAQIPHKI